MYSFQSSSPVFDAAQLPAECPKRASGMLSLSVRIDPVDSALGSIIERSLYTV